MDILSGFVDVRLQGKLGKLQEISEEGDKTCGPCCLLPYKHLGSQKRFIHIFFFIFLLFLYF